MMAERLVHKGKEIRIQGGLIEDSAAHPVTARYGSAKAVIGRSIQAQVMGKGKRLDFEQIDFWVENIIDA